MEVYGKGEYNFMRKLIFIIGITLLSSGCQKYYISIAQEKVDRDYLASTALNTPDPRQKNPPVGEKLIVEWKLPREVVSAGSSLELHVIYRDYTEAFFTYPISHPMDYVVYTLIGSEYGSRKGILTYEAQVNTGAETPFLHWKHQLFTRLIVIRDEEQPVEESSSFTNESNSSVEDQSRQGSVIETDGLTDSETD